MTMERLTDLLFENSESIPNGLYLSLMNELRDMHRARAEPRVRPRDEQTTPPAIWVDFKTMWFSPPSLNMLRIGEVLEVLTGNGDKMFYIVKKVEDKYIVVDTWRIWACVQDAQGTRFKFNTETKQRVRRSYKQMQQLYFRFEDARATHERLRNSQMGWFPMDRLGSFEFSIIRAWLPPHLE